MIKEDFRVKEIREMMDLDPEFPRVYVIGGSMSEEELLAGIEGLVPPEKSDDY